MKAYVDAYETQDFASRIQTQDFASLRGGGRGGLGVWVVNPGFSMNMGGDDDK